MRLTEYINTPNILNNENIITLHKYESFVLSLQDNTQSILYLPLNLEILEHSNLCEIFQNFKNKIIMLTCADIDFPPPKKPYSYDTYFNNYNLPENHENINYYDKISIELIKIIENNNLYIFAHSISINHPRLNIVPLSIYNKFNHFHLKTNNKHILCYANFRTCIDRWYGNPRKETLQLIKNKPFITIENNISQDDFYHNLSCSKFAICPRGCGIDTYRLWDCICVGCIPIVIKYDCHNNEIYQKLPILYINDYNDLTEDFLNNMYENFLLHDYDYSSLLFSNLFERIESL
jgi:hypothetical protein